MNGVVVRDATAAQRYEAWVGAELAGFLTYEVDGGSVTLVHTQVDPALEGKGICSALARHALDHIRGAGRRVVPVCPFVKAWIERHPDYADLVLGGGPTT